MPKTKTASKQEEELFNELGSINTVYDDDTVDDSTPDPTSPEWNDYVMDQFTSEELIDGRPLVAGLRRVTELLIAPIIESGPSQVFPVDPDKGSQEQRATVIWKIVLQNGVTVSDVADCWAGNTDDKYVAFSVATAATRSEARALRKALKIRSVSAEEMTEKDTAKIVRELTPKKETTKGDYEDEKRMTDRQIKLISARSQKFDIDVEKLFKFVLGISVNSKVMVKQASSVIDTINEYQRDLSKVPEEIRGYNPEWRN